MPSRWFIKGSTAALKMKLDRIGADLGLSATVFVCLCPWCPDHMPTVGLKSLTTSHNPINYASLQLDFLHQYQLSRQQLCADKAAGM